MPQPIIRIEQLGKQYRSARNARRHGTLRDRVSATLARAWQHGGTMHNKTSAAAESAGFWALRDVSLDVEAGEILGIVGHNGSGKSTLLKILARITAPTTGYAVVRGRIGAMLEIGTGFHMELSGRENVYLSGAILGMRRAEIRQRFDEIVAFSGVEEFLELPVKRYSSGMYLRLAFAVASHLQTDCLLLDEVLAVGDAAFQASCLARIRELARQGRAIMLVSHDLAMLSAVCNRAALIDQGRVAALGPATEIIAPATVAA